MNKLRFFLSSLFKFRFRISFGFVLIMLQLFMLVFASNLVSSGLPTFTNIMIIYLLMGAVVFANANRTNPYFKIDFFRGMFIYLMFFFSSALVFSMFPRSSSFTYKVSFVVPLYTLLYALVVSFSEDGLFAVFLPRYIGRLPSALLFSLFHIAVYVQGASFGVLMFRLLFAFIMNLVFQYLNYAFDITASAGLHTAYNLYVMGLI